jgi:acetyl esterase
MNQQLEPQRLRPEPARRSYSVPRHPRVWLACRAVARQERRFGRPTIAPRRAQEATVPPPTSGDGVEVVLHDVAGPGGDIPTWIYRPPGAAVVPAHRLLHAGGFGYRIPKLLDDLARHYVRAVGCAVVTPHYRLAPEHPWPAARDDAYAVLNWLVESAGELAIDAGRVSIGGVSAGGFIAASTALLARDRGGPSLVFQLLEIPILDLTGSHPSVEKYGDGYLLTKRDLAEGYAASVPDRAQRRAASPLFADDLAGLPPALVLTAQYDPLRDEGEAYAQRLRDAGVPAETVRARNHVHSSTYSTLRSALRYRDHAAAALARALA